MIAAEIGNVILQAASKLREMGAVEDAAQLEMVLYVIPFVDLSIAVELPTTASISTNTNTQRPTTFNRRKQNDTQRETR